MLPDLWTGTTLAIFHSIGRLPDDSGWENNKVRYAAEMNLVFFRNFDVISSKPADDDSLMLEIMFEMPSIEMVIGGIVASKGARNVGNGPSDSLVNTEENAVLNALAVSLSDSISPCSLGRDIVRVGCGLMICQNFLVFSLIILARS